jgi:hypothetical protein
VYCNLDTRGIKSFADDLDVRKGPVSSRVALLLRSAEGKPFFAQISHAGSRDRAQVAHPACKGQRQSSSRAETAPPRCGGSPAAGGGAQGAAWGLAGGSRGGRRSLAGTLLLMGAASAASASLGCPRRLRPLPRGPSAGRMGVCSAGRAAGGDFRFPSLPRAPRVRLDVSDLRESRVSMARLPRFSRLFYSWVTVVSDFLLPGRRRARLCGGQRVGKAAPWGVRRTRPSCSWVAVPRPPLCSRVAVSRLAAVCPSRHSAPG